VHDYYSKMDLSDIRRPFSSNVGNGAADSYMKREQYPKFTNRTLNLHQSDSRSPDENMSLEDGSENDSGVFKQQRSLSNDPNQDDSNEQNESRI
jgi:hypothetical protein